MNRYHRSELEPSSPSYRPHYWSGLGHELAMMLGERMGEIRNEQDRHTEIHLATLDELRNLPDRVVAKLKEGQGFKTPEREGLLGALLRLVSAIKELAEAFASLKELTVGILLALVALRIIAVPEPVRALIFGEEKPVVEKSSGERSPH